jgi:hypothetical protein
MKTTILLNKMAIVCTVPCRKTRFFPTQITKLAVAPIISKIHKHYVPHSKTSEYLDWKALGFLATFKLSENSKSHSNII